MRGEVDKKKRFSSVILKHLSDLHNYALSLCRNTTDAEDLVSTTILKAYENFDSLKDESKTKQWILRILNNQFISNYRSRKNFVEIDDQDQYPDSRDKENFSLFDAIAKSDFVEMGNPEKDFISKITMLEIQQAIDELPIEFKQVLLLCDMEDQTYAEISQTLNIPIGTVRSRIARARTVLQRKLWLHAKQLGIKKSNSIPIKEEYTCTCGTEESHVQISIPK